MSPTQRPPWTAAQLPCLAAALLAVDPSGLGGMVLRSPPGEARDQFLGDLIGLLPEGTPCRRIPLHINDDRLLGGLDLAASLQAGRAIAQRGILAESDGGLVVLAMAERATPATVAGLCSVLDRQEVIAERQGVSRRQPARLGVVALDEGIDAEEGVAASLRERLAIHLTLDAAFRPPAPAGASFSTEQIEQARHALGGVRLPGKVIEALCEAALALGVASLRASWLACRLACAAAALHGRDVVAAEDAGLAAALVLAPRATSLPTADSNEESEATPAEPNPPEGEAPSEPPAAGDTATDEVVSEQQRERNDEPLNEVLLEAVRAAIPPGLLAAMLVRNARSPRAATSGRVGAARTGTQRGRPTGARRGQPGRGARLHLIETLRAAAPWQRLRRREALAAGRPGRARVLVRREDFHVWRYKQRSETTTVFVVDASGSAALHRLAEAKGAVELLLADCYVRRDSVAVIAFRGVGAEVLLPPTRSLVRAKRSLAGLPGGGGTPLAAGIDAATTLALGVRARGASPVIVMLTDGRANIALDGSPGRPVATEDALKAARRLQAQSFAALLLDTSPQPQEAARRLAEAMGARYLPLPHAGAMALSRAVVAAGSDAG